MDSDLANNFCVLRNFNFQFRNIQDLRQGELEDNLCCCYAWGIAQYALVVGSTNIYNMFINTLGIIVWRNESRFLLTRPEAENLGSKKSLFLTKPRQI